MPQQKQVEETYWTVCWGWGFAPYPCKKTKVVTKWFYRFSWYKEVQYLFYADITACENGIEYNWSGATLGIGSNTTYNVEASYDSPRPVSGKCSDDMGSNIDTVHGQLQTPEDERFTVLFRDGPPAEVVPSQTWDVMYDELGSNPLYADTLSVSVVAGAPRYTAVFSAGSGGQVVVPDWTWDAVFGFIGEMAGQGLRVTSINGFQLGGEQRFALVFREGSGAQAVIPNWTWPSMYTAIAEHAQNGMYMTAISAFVVDGEVRFAGVFRPGSGYQVVIPDWTWGALLAEMETLWTQGMHVASISSFTLNGEIRYAAVFRQGPAWQAVIPDWPWPACHDDIQASMQQGLHVAAIDTCF